MAYFIISKAEGAKSAENYFCSNDLGLLLGGVPVFIEDNEDVTGIYYISGINLVDDFLNHRPMADQIAFIQYYYYKEYQFVISFHNNKENILICIPKANISKVLIYDNATGLRRGRPLITGTGLLGFFGREVSKKLLTLKPELVNGINYSLVLNNGDVIKFFSPYPQYIDVLEFLSNFLINQCENNI